MAIALALLSLNGQLSTALAQGTAFTYQGHLSNNGNPASGIYDFRFRVAADAAGNNYVGSPFLTNGVAVSAGLFALAVDFGSGIFTGSNFWLQVDVRTNGGGGYTTLFPLQALTPTAYAIMANSASNLLGVLPSTQLSGALPSGQLNGTYSGAVTFNNASNVFNGSFAGNGSALSNINAAMLNGLTGSNFWKTTGNAGTTAGTHFLGTTDNQSLEVHVNGARALRIEPNANGSPNVIGGSTNNTADAGVTGAFIGGGGQTNFNGGNRISASWGTIGGGARNSIYAGGVASVVAGGFGNIVGTNEDYAFIGGGWNNLIQGGGNNLIAGGLANTNRGWASSIGGGDRNVIDLAADHSSIGGGGENSIGGSATLFLYDTIAGGRLNAIQGETVYSSIGGGFGNAIRTNAHYSVISGGRSNVINAGARYATIAGGSSNVAGGQFSFAAGRRAKATNDGAFVWADSQNADFGSTGSNQFLVRAGGGVGLGATNPAAQLHVSNPGGDSFPQAQLNQQNIFDYSRLRLTVSNSYEGRWDIGAVPTDFVIYSGFYGERLRLNSSGMAVNGPVNSTAFVGSGAGANFVGNGAGISNINLALNSSNAITPNSKLFTVAYAPMVGDAPFSVVAADINGDGRTDLISANFNGDTLTVLTNDGSARFATAFTLAAGNGPTFVAAADMNGDGRIDLVSADSNSGTLSVLTNLGSGGFAARMAVNVFASGPRSVAVADVNGDGRPDLISANSGSLSVLTNSGNGFALAAIRTGSGVGNFVVAADVNSDARPDLITASGALAVLTNNGSGVFPTVVSYPLLGGAQSVTVADLNGDGRVDLIPAYNAISVLTNNGNGGFVTNTFLPIAGSGGAVSVAAVEINGDGRTDIVSANNNADTISVLTNNGSGVLALAFTLATGDAPVSVAATDLNGDSHIDLVTANANSDSLSVFLQTPFQFLGNFVGDGSGLNLLNASSLASGTISDARLSTNVALFSSAGDLFFNPEGDLFLDAGGQIFADAGTAAAPGYSYRGDSNTGIFSPAPDTVAITTGGSEKLRVASNGNVGIGTNNPQTALHVGGDVTATAFKGNSLSLGGSASNPLTVTADGTSTGGAGTSEVVARFSDNGAGHTAISIDAPANQDAILYFAEAGSAWWGLRHDADNSDKFQLRYHGNFANTTLLTVTTNGNVGIGTDNPASKLQINGTVEATNIKMATGAAAGAAMISDGAGNAAWKTNLFVGVGGVQNAGGLAKRYSVDAAGNFASDGATLGSTINSMTAAALAIDIVNPARCYQISFPGYSQVGSHTYVVKGTPRGITTSPVLFQVREFGPGGIIVRVCDAAGNATAASFSVEVGRID